MLKKLIAVVLLAVAAVFIAVLMGWVNINGVSRQPAAEQPPAVAEQPPAPVDAGSQENTIDIKDLKVLPNCQAAKAGGPEEVVRSIYDKFPWGDDDSIEIQPRKVLEEYFAPNLVELLLKAQKCDDDRCSIPDIWNKSAEKTPPVDIVDFRVCAMNPRGNVVRVQFRDYPDPKIFLYKLERVGSGWKISDVIDVFDFNQTSPDASDGWSLMDSLSDYYGPKH